MRNETKGKIISVFVLVIIPLVSAMVGAGIMAYAAGKKAEEVKPTVAQEIFMEANLCGDVRGRAEECSTVYSLTCDATLDYCQATIPFSALEKEDIKHLNSVLKINLFRGRPWATMYPLELEMKDLPEVKKQK